MNKKQVSLQFKTLEMVSMGQSRIYEFLSHRISKDHQILELSMNTKNGQPVPNLLFAAVHYLLLKGKDHPLKEFTPVCQNILEKLMSLISLQTLKPFA